jgi:hypothetical protein
VLEDLRLERRGVLRHEDPIERPVRHADTGIDRDDGSDVLRLAPEELLVVTLTDGRLREHDHAGLRTADARLPRSLGRGDLAVGVLGRVLAEVPDVPEPILRVPVEGVLRQVAVGREDLVVHHGGRHAEDHLRAIGDDDDVALALPV